MNKNYLFIILFAPTLVGMEYVKSLSSPLQEQQIYQADRNNVSLIIKGLEKIRSGQLQRTAPTDFRKVVDWMEWHEIPTELLEAYVDTCDQHEKIEPKLYPIFLRKVVQRNSIKLVQFYFEHVGLMGKLSYDFIVLKEIVEELIKSGNTDLFKIFLKKGLRINDFTQKDLAPLRSVLIDGKGTVNKYLLANEPRAWLHFEVQDKDLEHDGALNGIREENVSLEKYLHNRELFNQLPVPGEIANVIAQEVMRNSPIIEWLCKPIILIGHKKEVNSAKFNKEGTQIVTASWDKTAKIWDIKTGACVQTFRHENLVNSAEFNKEGTQIVTASWDKTAKIWDIKTGACIQTFRHENLVNSAEFNKEGTQVITASWDQTAKIWNVKTGNCVHILRPEDVVRSAQFNEEGTQVVTASSDGTVKIWDVKTGGCIHTFRHEGSVMSPEFNEEGAQVVTASSDGSAKIWDVKTGACIHTLRHERSVVSAQFNEEGTQVVTASWDKTVKIWDIKTGACIQTFRHANLVNSAEFNKEGTQVVTASNDYTAKIWDVVDNNYLENCLTLEQVLLLQYLYEIMIINRVQRERNSIKRVQIDWERFPHLKEVYNQLPESIQEAIKRQMISSGKKPHSLQ